MPRFTKLLFLAACIMLTSNISSYAADSRHSANQVVVHYGDLDLTQAEGAKALLARIDQAATKVCGGEPDIRDMNGRIAFRTCKTETMNTAVASVRSPLVARLYGTPEPSVIASR